jgi:hypothetical protein
LMLECGMTPLFANAILKRINRMMLVRLAN